MSSRSQLLDNLNTNLDGEWTLARSNPLINVEPFMATYRQGDPESSVYRPSIESEVGEAIMSVVGAVPMTCAEIAEAAFGWDGAVEITFAQACDIINRRVNKVQTVALRLHLGGATNAADLERVPAQLARIEAEDSASGYIEYYARHHTFMDTLENVIVYNARRRRRSIA
jgi:hypothetical protein